MTKYTALTSTILESEKTYHRAPKNDIEEVTLDSPAVMVMTDLKLVQAVTIEPTIPVEKANQKMIATGVRLLLVTDTSCQIIGLITATDILGEKPMQFIGKRGGTFSDITVQDIMTPNATVEVLQMADVEKAVVGDIVETLKRVGRQHTLVVDIDESNLNQNARGIFSSTQISRQMGIKLDVPEIVTSFAELEKALSR